MHADGEFVIMTFSLCCKRTQQNVRAFKYAVSCDGIQKSEFLPRLEKKISVFDQLCFAILIDLFTKIADVDSLTFIGFYKGVSFEKMNLFRVKTDNFRVFLAKYRVNVW